MDFDHHTFPSAVSDFQEPRIVDSNMTEELPGYAFDLGPVAFGSPSFFPNKSSDSRTTLDPNDLGVPFTQSSGSSTESSSSESDNVQYGRHSSSDSSHSGVVFKEGDAQMAHGITGGMPAPNATSTDTTATTSHLDDDQKISAELDSSNRAMECHFDFDSAAGSSSPHPNPSQLTNSSPTRQKMMPLRSKTGSSATQRVGPYSGRSKKTPERSPLAAIRKSRDCWSSATIGPEYSSFDIPGTYVNGAMLGGLPQEPWAGMSASEATIAVDPISTGMSHPPAGPMPFASPASTSDPQTRPILHVYTLAPKSRVETNFQTKLTIYPVPSGITKLHLAKELIFKPKLKAKPSPGKSPDMLELHAMLVCTSTMQDPEKLERARMRAASPSPVVSNEEPDSNSPSSERDESKPVNGWPIRVCRGCIIREGKRVARKNGKHPLEDNQWWKEAKQRSVVFNSSEVKEWHLPTKPVPQKSKKKDKFESDFVPKEIMFPNGALQVDIPMRITCYCRHQDEKLGFQIIFTLRDHEDNVLAQTMTTSIMITDDHKNNAVPVGTHPQSIDFTESSEVPGTGVFPQAPKPNGGPAPFRHAYSTTDLQRMRHQANAQHISPFAVPHNASYNVSGTATPKTLSRQASSSSSLEQQPKKRKTSNSGRMRSELTMTQLETSTHQNMEIQGTETAGQHVNINSGGAPTFAPQSSLQRQPMPLALTQYETVPTTPSTGGRLMLSSAQRSEAAEDSHTLPALYSGPNSVRPSRAPSPGFGSQNNASLPNHAQMLATSLYSVSGTVQTHRTPVIHKMTPAEGPTSGGIEVTCLGSGFFPGLEVMFGDAQATTTTFWGESALVCLVPPALRAGTVLVTFKQNYERRSPTPQSTLAVFKYIDDDEQVLMKHALALVNQKWSGKASDAADSARNIINFLGSNASFSAGSSNGSTQQQHSPSRNGAMSAKVDLETAVLSCLDLIDLDDSPFKVSFGPQGTNGQSMLHLSASLGYYRLTAGLLARGANPDTRDNNGITPMHLASLRGHQRIIRKLRSAGADPTLRSLNGFTPAEMATSHAARDASNVFDHHTRSRSVGATPPTHLSRASSVMSFKSSHGAHARNSSIFLDPRLEDGHSSDEASIMPYKGQTLTPAQMYARSRHNSMDNEQKYLADASQDRLTPNASLFAANPAISALRDQLSAQIQQLQQSVHRTLPALQIPAFPPIPNLPDYQAHAVVRRISSLVPQRNSRPSTADESSKLAKESDYHWWELLTGAASSPPAYEEIFPGLAQDDVADRKASVMRTAGETVIDEECEAEFGSPAGPSIMDTVDIGNPGLTKQQREHLRTAHARKVKKLRSDQNLFFIWIPLLILVLTAMLKDRVPVVLHSVHQTFQYVRERVGDRVLEVV